MTETGSTPAEVSSRAVMAVAGLAGAAVLPACRQYGARKVTPPPAATTAPTTGAPTTPPTGATTGATTAATTAEAPPGIAKVGDIPVGGGAVFAGQDTVITQPAAGQFKAFTATCTHAGCQVADVSNGTINCPCHGSEFAIADGSVVNGPAPDGLAEKTVTVTGDSISVS